MTFSKFAEMLTFNSVATLSLCCSTRDLKFEMNFSLVEDKDLIKSAMRFNGLHSFAINSSF